MEVLLAILAIKDGEANTEMVDSGADLVIVKHLLGQQTVSLLHYSRKSHFHELSSPVLNINSSFCLSL